MAGTSNHPPSADGSWHHQLGSDRFPAEPGRYHLYVGLFCPFAHRAMIAREVKGLQAFISVDVVKPFPKDDGGWRFPATNEEYPGSTVDRLFHSRFLHEIYFRCDPNYSGKYSVPVLWDMKTDQIVNNESEEIMRTFDTAFDDFLPVESPARHCHLYRPEWRDQIDEINSWLMPDLNSGVYKAGFATDQDNYNNHCRTVFATLDRLESIFRSSQTQYLLGSDEISEVDIKLYTTLIRFDAVYQQHFKLMIRSIRHGYPYLHRWLKNLYWNHPGFRQTTDFTHIKENYTKSHVDINPRGITPLGPEPEIESWTTEDSQWHRSLPSG